MKITLAAARVNKGLTIDKASELMGCSKPTLISWEKGITTPSIKNLNKILDTYGVEFDDLNFNPKSQITFDRQ